MLTKLSREAQLDQELVGCHRVERVLNAEVPCVRYLIGRIVKTYDYINHVVITLPLDGLRGYADNTLPSRCYVITMVLRVRRKFLKLLRSLTVASEPGLCVDVICTSRTQVSCGDTSHTAYQHVILWFSSIVG